MKYIILIILICVVGYEIYDLVKKINQRKKDNINKVADVSDNEKSED